MKARFIGGCNDAPFPGGGAVPNLYNGVIGKLLTCDFADPIDYEGEWTAVV